MWLQGRGHGEVHWQGIFQHCFLGTDEARCLWGPAGVSVLECWDREGLRAGPEPMGGSGH